MSEGSFRRVLASAGAILERIHPGHLGLASGAVVSDEASFAATPDRTKWDVAQR